MEVRHCAAILALSVAITGAIAAAGVGNAAAAIDHPGLMGVTYGPDGKPMEGVAVSARSTEQTFTTTVYSDDKGEYVFSALAAGSYKVWAQAETFVTDRADITIDAAHPATHKFSLKPLDNFEAQLTGAEWLAALPEDTADHRRMKQVLYTSCSSCHGLDVVLNNRFDESGWRTQVRSMESANFQGYGGQQGSAPGWELIQHHQDELAKYLTEMRGPGPSPMKLKPFARPTGEAARAIVTQYDLPNADLEGEMPRNTGSDWMLGESTGSHGMAGIHDAVADNHGNVWITQSRPTFETNRQLIKLDPKSGNMTAFKVDDNAGQPRWFEQMSQPDVNGDIWMQSGSAAESFFEKLDPNTGSVTAYPVPKAYGGAFNSIDTDSKGHVWANGRYGAVEFDLSQLNKTGAMNPGWHYYLQSFPSGGLTDGISVDAGGNPWWSESYSDKVAVRDMKSGKVTEFDMRDPGYDQRKALFKSDLDYYDSVGAELWAGASVSPLPFAEFPRRLAADKNGDTVWIPNWAQSSLAEINTHTMKVTYHELPLQMHPYKTIVDKFHDVYTDTEVGDGMYKFNPSIQQWTYFQLPTHGCSSRHISFDDNLNEVWIPCDQADTVDRIQFRTPEQIQTLKTTGSASRQ